MKQALTIKLKLHSSTKAKSDMYQTMANRTTALANRYLSLDKEVRPRTSRGAERYSEKLPSAVLAQAIREIKSKKKAGHFDRLWPCNVTFPQVE